MFAVDLADIERLPAVEHGKLNRLARRVPDTLHDRPRERIEGEQFGIGDARSQTRTPRLYFFDMGSKSIQRAAVMV